MAGFIQKFWLISIVAGAKLSRYRLLVQHRNGLYVSMNSICGARTCVFMFLEEKKCRMIHFIDYLRRNKTGRWKRVREQTGIIQWPDPLTQAAQHKCCNPLFSKSNANKALALHHVAYIPPSTWNYCVQLTQLAFPWKQIIFGSVFLTQPFNSDKSRPILFVCFVFVSIFPPKQDYVFL